MRFIFNKNHTSENIFDKIVNYQRYILIQYIFHEKGKKLNDDLRVYHFQFFFFPTFYIECIYFFPPTSVFSFFLLSIIFFYPTIIFTTPLFTLLFLYRFSLEAHHRHYCGGFFTDFFFYLSYFFLSFFFFYRFLFLLF